MNESPIMQRLAASHQWPGLKTALAMTGALWLVTLGVSIPLAFAHAPFMDAVTPVLGPILLLFLLAAPFVVAAVAGSMTAHGREQAREVPGSSPFRAYYLAILFRLRALFVLTVGLAPLSIIVLFYRAPEMPFEFLSLLEGGLLLLPFIGLLTLRPLLAAAIGVWFGMRLRNRWLAGLAGPLVLLLILGIELGLDRYQVARGQPIYIGDTVEYPDVSPLQTAITILLALDGLSPLAIFALIFSAPQSRRTESKT